MGKRRKRMLMKKYAKKYALKRKTLGFDKQEVTNAVVTIDMTTSEEIKEEEQVQVVVNDSVAEKKEENLPRETELELDLIQVEESDVQKVDSPVLEKKPTRRRKATTTAKKSTTTRKTTARKRRTTKKTTES